MGNTDIEDGLRRLDNLTQEEAKMAAAEHLKIAHTVEGKVMGVDGEVKGVRDSVQGIHNKLDDTTRSSSLSFPTFSFRMLRSVRRKPAPR
jgi:hypothetical protein